MKANDFILQTRADLQEKSQHWKNEELFVKLQRCYIALQFDLPFFITRESVAIKKDKSEYHLLNTPLKNVGLKINSIPYDYIDIENFYTSTKEIQYSFDGNKLLISSVPTADSTAEVAYRYQKALENGNCEIETPSIYNKALRFLFLSDIHEKPTRNTKERDLSVHYLKLYKQEVKEQVINKKSRPKNITSKYQIV